MKNGISFQVSSSVASRVLRIIIFIINQDFFRANLSNSDEKKRVQTVLKTSAERNRVHSSARFALVFSDEKEK